MAGTGGRRWGVRVARGVLWSLAAAHVVEAVALARRWRSIGELPAPVALADGARSGDVCDVVAVGAGGTEVDPATRAAAARELETSGAAAVDLVPGDLPAHRALRLLRRVDPGRLGDDALYSPGGAHEAVVLRRSLAERMEAGAGTGPRATGSDRPDRGDLAGLTVRAQRHAPAGTRLLVAPRLRAAPASPRDRWRELEELTGFARFHGSLTPILVAAETVHLLAMTAGALVAPGAAAAALVTWSAQPAIVFARSHRSHRSPRTSAPASPGGTGSLGASGSSDGAALSDGGSGSLGASGSSDGAVLSGGGSGSPGDRSRSGPGASGPVASGASGSAGVPGVTTGMRPPGLARAVLLRLADAWVHNVRTAAAGYRQARAERRTLAATPAPAAPPAAHELFEPRRGTCPWCGAGELTGRLDTVDLFLHKAGRFHLDECTACGHVFQNPALSVAGLGHYYDQFYDGLGEELAEWTFAGMADAYRSRAEAIARYTEPRAWLDVGTGHGHFCLFARRRWPAARFDGLDTAEAVEEAGRRGWLDTAYRGLFPDIAGRLPHAYDVVSMHHYLEHTRDPRRELDAAAKVLEPGGHLLIEMPDPASPWTRLGRYWLGWLQPQHQHMVTHDNMVAALGEVGFEVVSTERATADDGGFDLFVAAFLAVDRLAPNPRLPWRPRPSAGYRAGRLALFGAVLPVLGLAAVGDVAKNTVAQALSPTAPTNAYRIVARRT